MLKKSLLLTLLMALLVPWVANAQSVQLGDGTSTNNYLPSYSLYNYSVTQQIYTAGEINASGNITSIAFFNGGSTKSRQLAIYMAHTNKSAFELTEGSTSASTDWVALTESDKVYEASDAQTITAGEWTTFTLDTPFAYNGTDNLIIGVLDLTGSWESGMACRVFTTESKQAIYKYQDAGAYGIDGTYNGAAQSGTLAAVKNQIVLGGIQQAYPSPTNVTATPYPTSAKIQWTENGTATQWEIAYKVATDDDFTTELVNTNPYTIDGLRGVTNYTVKVRAYYSASIQSAWSGVANFTTLPSCPAPTELTTANLTTTSVTLNWTPGYEETDWVLQYGSSSTFADGTYTEINISGRPTDDISGLTENTIYYARVKADCGGAEESVWSSTLTFATKEPCPDGLICIGEGVSTSNYLPLNNYYKYSLTQQIYTADEIGEAGAILSIAFYKAATIEAIKNLEIYIVSTDKTAFSSGSDWVPVTASDLVYSGTVTFDDNAWSTIDLDNPFIYDGTSNIAIMVNNITGAYKSNTGFYVFSTAANQAIYRYQDGTTPYDPFNPGNGTASSSKNRIRLSIGEPPACPKPTSFDVNYVEGTTATATWVGTASSYEVDVNGTTYTTTNNTYNLTGLSLATDYEVKVRANCGSNGYSEWTNSITFTTDACMPSEMTMVYYSLEDSYGDGWNGNEILVVDESCNIIEELTIGSGYSNSGVVKSCGQYLAFYWYAGDYPGETSWEFTDAGGNVLFSGTGTADMATLDELYVIDNYPYKAPSNFEANYVGPHSAEISWTENGTATAWEIMLNDDDTNLISANTNPFTVTGLDAETDYTFNVRAVGSGGASMWPCIYGAFTTTEPCPSPTITSVTPNPTNAVVEWYGFSESYNIQYAELPAAKDEGIWMQYDNDTYYTNIGSTTSGVRTWGVMYPAYMIQGHTTLTKVAVQESATYYTAANYTVNIYSGKDQPETLLGTETVVPTGSSGMHEITLSSPITINPAQNLWITLTVEGTYVMAACQNTERNNQWWDDDGDGVWTNMADDNASLADYGWMIRGYVEDFDANAFSWTTLTNVTSPYTITGLTPETTYVAKLVGDCGADGTKETWFQFTTPSACDAPIDLTAVAGATEATLTWSDYQDSYNLRYRTAVKYFTIWEDDFESGLSEWTILHGDDATAPSGGYWYTIDPTSGLSFESHSGDYCASSWSWNSSEYQADNYLVTPQLEFQGVLKFYVRTNSGYPDSYEVLLSTEGNTIRDFGTVLQDMAPAPNNGEWNEVVIDLGHYAGQQGYIAIHHQDYDMNYLVIDDFGIYTTEEAGEWVTANPTEATYTATGLTPETEYEWQVQGINTSCTDGLTDWTALHTFITEPVTTLDQVITLGAGANWVSTYVEITLDDLKAALVDALPGATNIKITSQANGNTNYNGSRWRGTLNTLNATEMYTIEVPSSCEIILTGMPLDPATNPVTIASGNNWIAFPMNTSMTVANAFAGFAVNSDKVTSQSNGFTTYTGRWRGTLSTLEPNSGYIYGSASTETRTFSFPISAKAAPKSIQSPKTMDASLVRTPVVRTAEMYPTK